MTYLAIAGGGAIGALLRYILVTYIDRLGILSSLSYGIPLGVFLVNLLGSFAIGALSIVFQYYDYDELRQFMQTGLLGAFTTFSAFSLISLELLDKGMHFQTVDYITLSVCLCVSGAMLGRYIMKVMLG